MPVVRPAQLTALEQDMRRRLGQSVLDEIRTSTPHAINGLSKTEVDARLDIAIGKSARHRLGSPEDFRAFVRLCFVVGPNFDEYQPFQEILRPAGKPTALPIMDLFCLAKDEDWYKAAQYDIVSRYREPVVIANAAGQPVEHRVTQVSLTPLVLQHAEPYFAHALHPDVWRLAGMKPLTTLEDVQQFILEQKLRQTAGYAIVGVGEEFLGAVFVASQHATRSVSYWVARPMWGKGIATQALTKVRDTLRRDTVAPIMLRVDDGNLPSIKVAGKCGFRRTDNPPAVCFVFEA